jgi:hypothetical protein
MSAIICVPDSGEESKYKLSESVLTLTPNINGMEQSADPGGFDAE